MRPIAVLAACCLLAPAVALAQLDPAAPAGGWHAGGYANLVARELQDQPASLGLDQLSLLLWWEGDSRYGFFAEVELEDVAVLQRGRSGGHDAELVLERLHADYAWSDALKLRIGKFLTPVGRWNQIHAAPLTWTTSRPLITESTFPTNATGAQLSGTTALAGRALEWSLYLSPGRELLAADDLDPFREAYGGRLDYQLGAELQLGLSLVAFEQRQQREEHRNLYGIDFQWQRAGFELSGEYALRTRERGEFKADERGSYLQLVAPLAATLYGVARYETFDAAGAGSDLHLYLGGLAWRWQPGRVAKLEYRHATENRRGEPEGVLASIAVLF